MFSVDIEKNFLKNIPKNPGIYKFYDKNKSIIYIGKAKVLINRVRQYFNSLEKKDRKIQKLVIKIKYVDFIVANSEEDAFILENSLIKQFLPKYNIMLKDGKTYPWICIKKEPFPRVFSTRNLIKDGSKYYGPYSSGILLNGLLELFRDLYPTRTCSLNLTQENIKAKKFNKCLEYDIGKCNAPCINKINEQEYKIYIDGIKDTLKGNINVVRKRFEERMINFSENMDYKNAQRVKEQLEVIDRFKQKSTISLPKYNNIDVFTIKSDEKCGYINYVRIIKGNVVNSHSISLKKKLDEKDSELLTIAIHNLRKLFQSNAKEIICSFEPSLKFSEIKYTIPLIGDKKKLLEFSNKNLLFYIQNQKLKESVKKSEIERNKSLLEKIKTDLNLKNLPQRIECFDNSNIQGTNPVCACVVFINAKPCTKEYRIFNIKTVEGPDDFKSMKEGVYRRYKRLLDEKKPLPQLIVIDGGKGQLSAAFSALKELKLENTIEIIGIAKRLEEIFKPNDSIALYLNKRSECLKVIQHCRDEAHRFGLKHHRNKRSKYSIVSELDKIKGIGDKTKMDLLKKIGGISKIKNSSLETLENYIGKYKAKIIYNYFNDKRKY